MYNNLCIHIEQTTGSSTGERTEETTKKEVKMTMAEDSARNGEQRESVRKRDVREKKSLISYVFAAIVIFLVVYAVIAIISQQAQIANEEENLAKLREEITEAQQINDEYSRILSAEDEKAYMERIAIERMGYGYPGEKRFYAMDGS